jgi:hypothetical protein
MGHHFGHSLLDGAGIGEQENGAQSPKFAKLLIHV